MNLEGVDDIQQALSRIQNNEVHYTDLKLRYKLFILYNFSRDGFSITHVKRQQIVHQMTQYTKFVKALFTFKYCIQLHGIGQK